MTDVPQSRGDRPSGSRPARRRWPTLAAAATGLIAAAGAALLTIGPVDPVGATPDPTLPAPPRAGAPPPEITLSGLGPGQGVSGFIGPVGSVSNPAALYPPDTTTFTPLNEGFAGVILASPGGLQMYCINILTPTNIGYGYNLGTWDEANVNNVGFVARLLNGYYPNTAQPPIGANGVVDTADQAAAVQAAIWYFSDNYVLAAGDPLQAAVASIVNTVRLQPPLPAPTPPSLQITPASIAGDTGTPVGPYVVATDDPTGARVTATGATMFADAGGTTPIANGALVPTGTQIWLSAAAAGSATLTAEASALVPSGNAYLYSGNIAGVTDAQRLILAQTVRVTAGASATAEFTTPTTTTTSTTTTTTTTTTAPTTTTSTTTTTSSTTTSSTSTTSTTVTPTTPTTSPSVAPSVIATIPQTGSGTTRGVYAAGLLLVAAGCFAYVIGRLARTTA